MERALGRGHKKEEMDPIIVDEEQIKEIMERVGVTHNKIPYQYNINRKKMEVVEREGLESDEEEVEDLCTMGNIEEILRITYERKIRGQRYKTEEGSQFHIRISVEPTTPCATKTSEEDEPFRQLTISGRRILVR
jgi:hypothetical protein